MVEKYAYKDEASEYFHERRAGDEPIARKKIRDVKQRAPNDRGNDLDSHLDRLNINSGSEYRGAQVPVPGSNARQDELSSNTKHTVKLSQKRFTPKQRVTINNVP